MKIIDFVSKKEIKHEMNTDLVEKRFGYVPFFDFTINTIDDIGIEKHNDGISHLDWEVESLDDLERAWEPVYQEYKKYFKK